MSAQERAKRDEAICSLLRDNVSYSEIAADFGITKSAVQYIAKKYGYSRYAKNKGKKAEDQPRIEFDVDAKLICELSSGKSWLEVIVNGKTVKLKM